MMACFNKYELRDEIHGIPHRAESPSIVAVVLLFHVWTMPLSGPCDPLLRINPSDMLPPAGAEVAIPKT